MKTTLIIVALSVVLAGWYYLYQNRAPEAPTPSTSSGQAPPAATGGETYAVAMNASGFSPANLAIKVGDTVVFRNADTRTRWPASGLHPTHQLCPGLDALKPMQPGEEYSHIFAEAKECPMHDHLLPAFRGKITVAE